MNYKKDEELVEKIDNCLEELKNYIVGRYDEFEDIGSFHIEYSHSKNEFLLQVYGVTVNYDTMITNIQLIIEGLYEIFEERDSRLAHLIENLKNIDDVIRLQP